MADNTSRERHAAASATPPRTAHEPDAPRRTTPWNTVGGRVISLVSRKGGVGKTTSAVNLGAALALSGHTVLVVGTDPQCGVCRSLGVRPDELPVSLTDLFDCSDQLTDLVQISPLDGLHFVSPRVLTLEDEERYVDSLQRRAGEFVREIDRARAFYDTILIDCPPSLGAAARAALLASDSYLVPVQAEELCRESVQGLLEFVDEFRARHFLDAAAGDPAQAPRLAGAPLALEGMFLTMASEHTRLGRHVAARVAEDFGDLMFETAVPRTTRLAEMALRGKPAVIYDRRSAGSRAYFDLADELVERYCRGQEEEAWEASAPAPFPAQTMGEEMTAAAVARPGNGGLSGFDRFLCDLAASAPAVRSCPAENAGTPDMVSLEDLLCEEEAADRPGEDYEEGYWAPDSEGFDRIN